MSSFDRFYTITVQFLTQPKPRRKEYLHKDCMKTRYKNVKLSRKVRRVKSHFDFFQNRFKCYWFNKKLENLSWNILFFLFTYGVFLRIWITGHSHIVFTEAHLWDPYGVDPRAIRDTTLVPHMTSIPVWSFCRIIELKLLYLC